MPNRRPASIPLLSWSFNTKKFTCKLGCSPYPSGSCRKAFSKMSFQWKCPPPPQKKPKKFHNLACWQNKTKRKMNQLRKSDWKRIKGKFVNTSESTSRSVLGLFMQLCKSTLTVSFHPLSLCHWGEKFTNCKGNVPDNYICRAVVKSDADDFAWGSLEELFMNLPSISPQSDFLNSCFLRFVQFC